MHSILTVTTPAAGGATAFDLTTKEDVKADLGISGADDDAVLQRYVSESSLAIANACGRVFAKETVSELFRPEVTPHRLVLRRWPVVSIVSIQENGVAIAGADYEVDKDTGLLFRLAGDARTCWSAEKIIVAYEAGFGVLPGAAPRDLQKSARAMAKAQWYGKGRDPLIRSESTPGVYEAAYWVGALPGGDEMVADISTALANYRDVRA